MTLSFFLQTLVTGLSSGIVAYMMVAGMSLIISGMNMVNFGQGAFYVLGTYLTYTIAAKIGYFPALIIVPVVIGIMGFFVERAVRPLFGKNMLYIMLFTYGVAYIVCDAMVFFCLQGCWKTMSLLRRNFYKREFSMSYLIVI